MTCSALIIAGAMQLAAAQPAVVGTAADVEARAAQSARVRLQERSPFPADARGRLIAVASDIEDRPLLKERPIKLSEAPTRPGKPRRKR